MRIIRTLSLSLLCLSLAQAITITSPSTLPAGTLNQYYSYQLTVSGATGKGVYFAAMCGQFRLNGFTSSAFTVQNSSGLIYGTPRDPGTYTASCQVQDLGDFSVATTSLTIQVAAPPPIIGTSTLPNGLSGSAYSTTLSASSGTAPYTWSISSGSLPPGITLSGATLSGTPTTAGTYNFTVRVTDAASQTATQPLSITIGAGLSISTASLPAGAIGTSYWQALSGAGGTPPYSWAVSAGSLPPGLSLSSAGVLSGTPSTGGDYTVTIQATDSTSPTAQTSAKTFALHINSAPVLAVDQPPTNGTVFGTYSFSGWAYGVDTSINRVELRLDGTLIGTAAYGGTRSDVCGAGSHPGCPNVGWTYSFVAGSYSVGSHTLRATAYDNNGLATYADRVFSIPSTLAVTTTSLPGGLVGTSYSQTVAASGGTPGYSWSVTGGSLPPGLSLSGNTISGTPTTPGTFPFTVHVTDAGSPVPQTATQSLSISVTATLAVSTSSLPNALATSPYSQVLSATGGIPGYSWSLLSGSLPPGLLLNSSGTIYGTPTAAGTYNFTVQVADAASQTASKSLSISVGPPLRISTPSLPNGIATVAYSQTLTAAGGTPGYTWIVAAGTLPPGLTLSSGGAIAGTPTTAGTYSFTVQASDSTAPTAQTATKALSIVITPGLTITTASLPNALVTTPYSRTLAASGGTAGYRWSLAGGSLPPGLVISTAGVISGTPTAAGTFAFTVAVTDSTVPTPLTATKPLSIAVGAAIAISTTSLPNVLAGTTYSQSVTAIGGTPPYTFTITTGGLPPGISLSSSGSVYGVPTIAGTYNFTVQVTDSTAPTAQTASAALSITVSPGLSITTTSLPAGLATTPYSQSLAAAGGTSPYTWALTSGSFPTGLALSGNTISGTPITPGAYSFVVRATDSTTPTAQTASQALTITIGPAVSITSTSLATGVVSKAYSQPLTAAGGTSPYVWAIASGALPPGLTLSGATISGTPSTPGTYSFTLRVTDNTTPTHQTATLSTSILITAAFAITTASPLPSGLAGTPYSATIVANGGTPPYTFTLASGATPAGLTLQSNGVLSGTPTAEGSTLFSVLATDSTTPTPQTQIKPLAITIAPQLAISTDTLPSALVTTPYAQTLVAAGGTPPYVWTISAGTLPAGLALTSSGTISGTPIASGTSTFTVRVTDSTSPTAQIATQTYTVITTGALTITTSSVPPAVFGLSYNTRFEAVGGTGPYKWNLIAGSLPSGLSLSTSGYLSGTCTSTGVYTITVQATDSTSPTPQTATRVLTVDSNSALSIETTRLPDPLVNASYSATLNATGGVSLYVWSIAAGDLPAGLTLTPDGAISGVPTTSALTSVTIRVTDTASNTATRTFNADVLSPLSITTTALPGAIIGTPYSVSLAATGGASPYTWSLAAGQLPAGLTLSASGLLAGTPTLAGSVTFSVQVADTTQPIAQTATQNLTIVVADPLLITTRTLPLAISGVAYTQPLGATGGTPPYAWSITSGALPQGLVLDAANGSLSGTPTVTGSSTFTARVVDAGNQAATQSLTLVVVGPLSITTTAFPVALTATSYSYSLTAVGGSSPYSWALVAGSLPTGLTLDSTTGTISGVPNAPGTASITVQVTDSASQGSQTATKTLVFAVATPLTISTTTMAEGLQSALYNQSLTAAGGTPPYSWSRTAGTLPAGLSLSTDGTISGTPTEPGTFSFTAQVSDSTSPTAQIATKALALTINPPLSITTTTLPTPKQGEAYNQSLSAVGGTKPYTWSIASGSLPAGLTLSSDGIISGNPTTGGPSSFTVSVVDATAPTHQSATAPFLLNTTVTFFISTQTLPAGVVGNAYSVTLAATGGTTPYTWRVSNGTLPPGLNLSFTGALAGTPLSAGTYSFGVTVTDAATPAQSASTNYTVAIQPTLLISTTAFPDGSVGTIYSQSLAAVGGVAPYTWSLTAGSLAPGLTLAANGTISGISVSAAATVFTVQVTDTSLPTPQTATREFGLTIGVDLAIATSSLPDGYVSRPYSAELSAQGGRAPYAWHVDPSTLPPGLSLSASGIISGTPTATGVYTLIITASDSATPAHNSSRTFALSIRDGLTVTTSQLPDGQFNVPYTAMLAASGGSTPYTWTVATGSLPPGLSLSPGGTISGTPTGPGGYTFTIAVSDSSSPALSTSKTLAITIGTGFTITTASLPTGSPDIPYLATLLAAGGTEPYAWTVASGTLPPGLSLAANGTIAGIPSNNGTYSFTVQAADASQPQLKATRLFSITVGPALTITTPAFPNARLGAVYRQSLTAINGTPPYMWTLTDGALPPGLILLATGDILAQPTAVGSYTFTVTVTDSAIPSTAASRTYTINVVPGFAITTAALPNASPNVPYDVTLEAVQGTPPYTWSLALGSLPAGVLLNGNTGRISGTPHPPGYYPLIVQAADSSTPAQTTTRQFILNVDTALSITTSSLPDAQTGQPYYQALSATNGLLPYTWALASTLAPGLTLLPSGEIYGTPTTAGQYRITVTVADSSDPAARSSRDLVLLITRSLAIATTVVPTALVSKPYATVISAAGGTPPYRFSSSGSLPRGLSLASTGAITGTPVTGGQYRVVIKVLDGAGDSAEREFVFAVGDILAITTAALPAGTTNSPYFAVLASSGGTPPYRWSLAQSTLPPGLTFLQSLGVILGSPTTPGQYPLQVTLADATQSISASYVLSITNPLAIATSELAAAQQSLPYSQTLAATGGHAPYTWSVAAGSLPSGLTLLPTGLITGTTTNNGPFPLPLCVADSTGLKVCATRTVIVGPAFHIDPAVIPPLRRDQPFTYRFAATGARGATSWSSAFALPSGIALSPTGTLSGTPTTTGTYTITVMAADEAQQIAVQDITLTVIPPLTIQTTVLTAATVGTQYAAGLQVASGTAPYTWSLSSGTLPTGFHLDPAGIIYGFPSAVASATFVVTVLDSSSPAQTATAELILTVDQPLVIKTNSLPPAVVGSSYRALLDANGVAPLQWIIVAGALPDGLTLGPDGAISGTPARAGTFDIIASTTDAHGQSAAAAFSLRVGAALAMPAAESTLPDGTVGTPYSYQLHTTFTTPVTWDLVLGSLPSGMSLSSSGLLAGTPTAAGTTTFMLQASGGDQTATQIYSITMAARVLPPITAPTIPAASTNLAPATVGDPWAVQLTATGGTPPYRWTMAAGSLATGLALAYSGTISGTPAVSGINQFALTVTDANNQTATATFALIVRDGLAIVGNTAFDGHVGLQFSAALTAVGGTPPYTWSTDTHMPAGLTLSRTGIISGTPTARGSYPIDVAVHDANDDLATSVVLLRITESPIITTASLPNGTRSVPYSAALAATGGSAPYSWVVVDGALPPGLTLSGGSISGLPTASGTYHFALLVTDATGQTATAPFAVRVADALVVNAPGSSVAYLRKAYTLHLTAQGGTPPYIWSAAAGTLPPGLALSSGGTISGTPTTAGDVAITVTATDASTPSVTASALIQLQVLDPLAIKTTELPPASRGTAYNVTLDVSGGNPPFTWFLSDGTLPAGLTLSGHSISGLPSNAGTSSLSLTVSDASNQSATAHYNLTVYDALTITSASVIDATIRHAVSFTLVAAGGTPPYTWSFTSADLPPGLSLDTKTGRLSGTPTASASVSANITVRDSARPAASASSVLQINISDPLTITTAALAPAPTATRYTASLQAVGGTEPYTWTISDGQLPEGITLAANRLEGTPTTPGTSRFTVTVTDSHAQTASAPLSLLVSDGLTITTTGPVLAIVGRPLNTPLTATGGVPPYSWSVASGSLPAGLALASNGTLSGTPSTAGAVTLAVAVHDAAGAAASAAIGVRVTDALAITTTALPALYRSTPYTATLVGIGGTPPYTWTVSAGTLPSGLVLDSNAGVLSGTTSNTGASQFTITLTDSTGRTTTASYSIAVGDALQISTTGPLLAPSGKPSTLALTATGGTAPYTWSITAGSLPAGLSLVSTTGTIIGTPTTATAVMITFAVRDSAQPPAAASATLELRTNGEFAVATATLPQGFRGSPYHHSLEATGGQPPYTWSLGDGQLPPGLALSMDGLIAGTPAAQGDYRFTVIAADSTGQTASALLTCTITPLSILTTGLPLAKPGSAYLTTLDARGGLPPYRWSSAGLPAGLAFSGDGVLSGTPLTSSSSTIRFTVIDADDVSVSTTLQLTVTNVSAGRPRITGPSGEQVDPGGQIPLSVTLDQPAPISLTGVLTLAFAPTRPGRDDAALVFLPANARTIPFTVPQGSTTASFDHTPLLQTGTTAGIATITAQLTNADAQPGTLSVRIPLTAPVITSARILARDKYSLDLEVLGYATTTEVLSATFAFVTRGQVPPDAKLDVQQLFATWYLSQRPADQAGTFRYTQRLNSTADLSTISEIVITLTNTVGPSTPYRLVVN